jgi:chromosomal replication initiation ATPase DnaA
VTSCSECPAPIKSCNKTGFCRAHYHASICANPMSCKSCGKRLKWRNVNGFCREHWVVSRRIDSTPIMAATSTATGIKSHRIVGPEQSQPIVDARAVAAVALYRAGHTMVGIGGIMARDHSSICHLVRGFDQRALKRPHLHDALALVLAA